MTAAAQPFPGPPVGASASSGCSPRSSNPEERVLVLAPTQKDASLARSIFERAGVECLCCTDLEAVCMELKSGAAALLLAEEAIVQEQSEKLAAWLASQPPWSDLPLLVLARPGAESVAIARAIDVMGNVTVLERPTRVSTLVSAVKTALRARQRQYQIREHLAERQRTEAALRINDRRKDEFLAVLAHELRNPLAPIQNALHILRRSGTNDGRTIEVSQILERQVNHLVRLVDDLLEVSRISRGRIELRKERIDVATAIRTAVEASRPLIDAAGHELSLAVPETPLTIEADPVRITQVLTNLLNNAAKYTAPNGKIWLTAQAEDDQVSISVRDDGNGISPEMLPGIFDLFTQADANAGRAQGGLGIGLTLAKMFVEMHGGTVHAFSPGSGEGSEFVVRLPLLTGVSPAAAAPPRATDALARRRVLVVDDNRDSADSLGMLLGLLGAHVRVVYSGIEALDALEVFRPGVILLDIGMPGMDGHEVARTIRQRPEFKDVRLIALTGWAQKEDVLRTRASGFDYHVTKPADLGALERLLSSTDVTSADLPSRARDCRAEVAREI
jgi:signal transduction histidine kinase/ActR/RegA family two-component response regulator